MGLGGFPDVSLVRAREGAQFARELIAEDKDPLEEKKKTIIRSFGEAADHLVETLKADWTNEKHRQQWMRTVLRLRPVYLSCWKNVSDFRLCFPWS